MGLYSVGLCVLGACFLYGVGHPFYFVIAIINAIANLWSFGVMHNFRLLPEAAPDNWSGINLVTTLIGLAAAVYGFILNVKTA